MKVVTYNILADCHIKPEWYPRVSQENLDWERRLLRLVKQILNMQADVLCLQEVEGQAFNEFYQILKPLGYEGIYSRKSFGRMDGCATFFKEKILRFNGGKVVIYNDQGSNGGPSGHIALILHLEWNGKTLGVVNTHIRWNQPEKPPEEHRGYRQVKELVKYLQDDNVDEWVICGDFNAQDDTPVIQLMDDAGFVDVGKKKQLPTMNKGGLVRIDYIFHSPGLQATQEKTAVIDLKTLLPSGENPSDHTPVAALFKN